MSDTPPSAAFDPLAAHGAAWCRVIPGFLSDDECRQLIAQSEMRGFDSADSDYPPSYRDNDRQVLDDAALAARLLPRLRAVAPATLDADDDPPGAWRLDAINDRFRFCRYRAEQSFGIHQDGVHHRSETHRSLLTFMIYLTDGSQFEGGDTVFYERGPGGPAREVARVRPRAGSLILFDHALWHAGEPLTAGVKHVLRSDVLYRRGLDVATATREPDFAKAHRGYVWTLEPLAEGLFASAGRDADIHVWDTTGRRRGTLSGHRRSVLGLAALTGGRLASVSRDRGLRIWNWRDGKCLAAQENAHEGAILAVVALPDGSLVTAGADGEIRHWSGDCRLLGLVGKQQGWAWALAASASGRVACAGEDGSVTLWRPGRAGPMQTLDGSTPLRTLVINTAGTLLASGDMTGTIRVWRAHRGTWRVERTIAAHAGAIRRLRLLTDLSLVSVGEDGLVRCWNLRDGQGQTLGSHANFATDLLQSGESVFSCGYDGCIQRLATRPVPMPIRESLP
jgi:hypothetical protein